MRVTRIEGSDLNQFKFDYDLTFMVFFLDSQGRIVSRYGGRDSRNADNRQSLEGLAHVMSEVARTCSEEPDRVIPKPTAKPVFAEGLGGGGEVKQTVGRGAALLVELVEQHLQADVAGRVLELAAVVVDGLAEAVPKLVVVALA